MSDAFSLSPSASAPGAVPGNASSLPTPAEPAPAHTEPDPAQADPAHSPPLPRAEPARPTPVPLSLPGYVTTPWAVLPDGSGTGNEADYDPEYAILTAMLLGEADPQTGGMILDLHKDMQGPGGQIKRAAWQEFSRRIVGNDPRYTDSGVTHGVPLLRQIMARLEEKGTLEESLMPGHPRNPVDLAVALTRQRIGPPPPGFALDFGREAPPTPDALAQYTQESPQETPGTNGLSLEHALAVVAQAGQEHLPALLGLPNTPETAGPDTAPVSGAGALLQNPGPEPDLPANEPAPQPSLDLDSQALPDAGPAPFQDNAPSQPVPGADVITEQEKPLLLAMARVPEEEKAGYEQLIQGFVDMPLEDMMKQVEQADLEKRADMLSSMISLAQAGYFSAQNDKARFNLGLAAVALALGSEYVREYEGYLEKRHALLKIITPPDRAPLMQGKTPAEKVEMARAEVKAIKELEILDKAYAEKYAFPNSPFFTDAFRKEQTAQREGWKARLTDKKNAATLKQLARGIGTAATPEARTRAITDFAGAVLDLLGEPRPEVVTFNDPKGLLGEARGNRLFINIAPLADPSVSPDVPQLLATILHERAHNWQHAVREGRIQTDERAKQAFINNRERYLSSRFVAPDEQRFYKMQPNEAHSFFMGEAASDICKAWDALIP